jgi:hypothetical protein
MARIKCINPKCTAPEGIFSVNDEDYLEPSGRFVRSGTPEAVDIIIRCPECGAENKVWAIGLKAEMLNIFRGF